MGEAIAIIGAGVSILGQQQGASAQQQQLDYQEDILINNRDIAEKLALDAVERGAVKEKGFRKSIEGFKGKQRAELAASGVVVDQDLALDLLLDTAEIGEVDALNIRNNAAREAFGYRAQAEGFNAQAAISGAQSASVQNAANIQGISTIIGTAGDIWGGK